MKVTSLFLAALLALAAATSALAADRYDERSEKAPDGKVVVGEHPTMMTVWDYFFHNPEKYRTMRNGPGEYYRGVERP